MCSTLMAECDQLRLQSQLDNGIYLYHVDTNIIVLNVKQ